MRGEYRDRGGERERASERKKQIKIKIKTKDMVLYIYVHCSFIVHIEWDSSAALYTVAYTRFVNTICVMRENDLRRAKSLKNDCCTTQTSASERASTLTGQSAVLCLTEKCFFFVALHSFALAHGTMWQSYVYSRRSLKGKNVNRRNLKQRNWNTTNSSSYII